MTKQLILFSDLDGTLLDHDTYSPDAALGTLHSLKALSIPCVLNTSKTYAELLPLRQQLSHQDAFIVENGAAVYLPVERYKQTIRQADTNKDITQIASFWCKSFAPSRGFLIEQMDKVRHQFQFIGFADMTLDQVVAATGLSADKAQLAMQRQFTEPFLWQDGEEALNAFTKMMNKVGLQVQKGGRFYHLMGHCDKADAMTWLANLHKQDGRDWLIMALGDGGNDVSMLAQSDIPVVIRSPAHPPPTVPGQNGAIVTEKFGPAGWAEAVEATLTQLGYTSTPDTRHIH